jgi:hypothetical protein
MSALLAIDPSVAHIGYAVLAMAEPPVTGGPLAAGWPRPPLRWDMAPLIAIGTWHIPASDDQGGVALEARMRAMNGHVGQLLVGLADQGHRVTHAVIERPITSTVYARNLRRGSNATINAPMREKQELSTGALFAYVEACGVRAHFAAPVSKRFRTVGVLTSWYPTLPRTSEHARAALALGLAALADHRRRWAA